ncbi:MAG: hypothetical protein FWC60_06985, partial [Firmicutes bacterium]|nr:hypothetical protein [Bacillota bacterium]
MNTCWSKTTKSFGAFIQSRNSLLIFYSIKLGQRQLADRNANSYQALLVTGQTLCLLVPVAQARKVINRKRFL